MSKAVEHGYVFRRLSEGTDKPSSAGSGKGFKPNYDSTDIASVHGQRLSLYIRWFVCWFATDLEKTIGNIKDGVA